MKLGENLLVITIILLVSGIVLAANCIIQYHRDHKSAGIYHVTIDGSSYVSDICPYVSTDAKYVRMRLYGNTVEFPFNNTVTIKLENK